MNDRPNQHSGSRWEPAPTPPGEEQPPAAEPGQEYLAAGPEQPEAAATPEQESAAAPGAPAGGEPGSSLFAHDPEEAVGQDTRGRRLTWRGRGPLVALATGIVALSGVGGYALGHAASATTDQVGLVGNQTPGNGQVPGNGQLPGGGMPGGEQGELEGVPPWGQDDGHGWGDRDGDGDGWSDRDGDGAGRGHHGWGPGTPPDGDQVPTPPDGSNGTTPDGTTGQGRET